MKLTYLNAGFYMLSGKAAAKLCRNAGFTGLPKPGYERRVKCGGDDYWLTRTKHLGKMVWAIYGRSYLKE